MSAQQHTPGPWFVERSALRGVLCVLSRDTWICGELQSDNITRVDTGECIANARLIAAAPELLEVLQALVDQILEYEKLNNLAPNPGRQYCWDNTARAVAVIAKARGEHSGTVLKESELASEGLVP